MERDQESVPEEVTLEKDLQDSGGKVFLAEETAGAKARGWECQVFSENTSRSRWAEQRGE